MYYQGNEKLKVSWPNIWRKEVGEWINMDQNLLQIHGCVYIDIDILIYTKSN